MRGARVGRAAGGLLLLAVLAAGGGRAARDWVAATVLPPLQPAVADTVLDRDGRLMRAYAVADGRWRLAPGPVDAGYLAQLIAVEDRRFHTHVGVDPLALLRAAAQAVWHGRVVSGGSTLTMQVARLLEGGGTGAWGPKLRQIRVALALERRLTKAQILTLYLTLAPYGGNIEGVRAAAWSYFGTEPARLTPAEAALLVALPQAPEARRPERHPAAARAARDRVLARAHASGVLDAADLATALAEPVPHARRPFPLLAPHLADRVRAPGAVRLHLDRELQAGVEALAAAHAARGDRVLSAAVIVADHRSGAVLAEVGSAGFGDQARRGWIDMTRAVRSPGSALKPFIYGLAFEQGLAAPETLIEDRPSGFGRYVPQNFDQGFQGTVSLRRALELSLNIPAVALLDAVGPARLVARLRRAGVAVTLPPGRRAGLAIALGGVGVTLADLTQAYAALARGGRPVALARREGAVEAGAAPVLEQASAWAVGDILRGTPPPQGAPAGRIAFKTGTSYGNRDAWALGFDGRHVVGVWMGRADGAPVPGLTGIAGAAPLLHDVFARIGPPVPLPPGPVARAQADLPPPLRRFRPPGTLARAASGPEIAYPPDGARIELGRGALVIKLRAGTPPFTWLIDGHPQPSLPHQREIAWAPPGPGFVTIAVIDARGQAARAAVFVTGP